MTKVAVLGASKGCARAMVVQALEEKDNGFEFNLLLRNPDTAEYTSKQKAQLTIIKGDAMDHEAVESTIKGTEIIVFSIGSAFNMRSRTMVTPNLCRDTIKVLTEVIESLSEEDRPKKLVVVSTTGLDRGLSEVPFLFRPLYRFFLHEPHMDKKELEDWVTTKNKDMFKWAIVRPSLLTDGKFTGKYRASEGISGYTISRQDVGHFLLHQCLKGQDQWLGKKVVVTY